MPSRPLGFRMSRVARRAMRDLGILLAACSVIKGSRRLLGPASGFSLREDGADVATATGKRVSSGTLVAM